VKGQPPADGYAHTLLIRRSKTLKITKKNPQGTYEVEYFLAHAPVGTPGHRDGQGCGPALEHRGRQQMRQGPARPGPVPGPQVGPVAPPRHHQHARPRVPRRRRRPAPKTRPPTTRPRRAEAPAAGASLLDTATRYSLAAIRGLLAVTVLVRENLGYAAAVARAAWRQRHQARAMISHHRRRGDLLPMIFRPMVRSCNVVRVALGDCGRAYGTSCVHEHSCLTEMILKWSNESPMGPVTQRDGEILRWCNGWACRAAFVRSHGGGGFALCVGLVTRKHPQGGGEVVCGAPGEGVVVSERPS
jgi:hypothetical protein